MNRPDHFDLPIERSSAAPGYGATFILMEGNHAGRLRIAEALVAFLSDADHGWIINPDVERRIYSTAWCDWIAAWNTAAADAAADLARIVGSR